MVTIPLKLLVVCGFVLISLMSSMAAWASEPVFHHRMKVELSPDSSEIQVKDEIRIPKQYQHAATDSTLTFRLHADLTVQTTGTATIVSQSATDIHAGPVPLKRYTLRLPAGQDTVTLAFGGRIHHGVRDPSLQYARSFSYSPGLIATEGVFLANSTAWYPIFDGGLVSFQLDVHLPTEWDAVSQGRLLQEQTTQIARRVVWEENNPQDDIYLVAGRFQRYQRTAGAIQTYVYLREADAILAERYLKATEQYIAMYSELIGPYPYAKFALIENFWETGYGMPSFTLLGSRVIRLPFILHSSYPHEILHNYWGNGVFVDYRKGNWSEGLTVYLADHLVGEQNGRGEEYRRDALQKYADFVSHERDFPIVQFTSRHSPSSEAIGYGKTMMLFHMLRLELGDEIFVQILRAFYREHLFRTATFADLLAVLNAQTDRDFSTFFQQWVYQPGAPHLLLENVQAEPDQQGYRLKATVRQTQSEAPYQLTVPVAVHLAGESAAWHTNISLDQAVNHIELKLPARPLRIDIDPQFDVFRRLDSQEIPPALSQGFGAENPLLVLPSKADKAVLQAYQQLADYWRTTQLGNLEVVYDDQLSVLPRERSVWILGWQNRFSDQVVDALSAYGVTRDDYDLQLDTDSFQHKEHAVVLTARQPSHPDSTLLWVAANQPDAIIELASKLPHYRKYSYLAFENAGLKNISKGQWPVMHSPLMRYIEPGENKASISTQVGTLKPRSALTELPPRLASDQ